MRKSVSSKSFGVFIFFLLVNFTQNQAFAQYFTGPVASGVGEAGRAAAETAEGIFFNPAVIAHAPAFSGAAFYQDGYRTKMNHETVYGLSLVDNGEDVVIPGGLAYLQSHRTFAHAPSVDETIFYAAVGNFVAHQLALGMSVYRLEQEESNGNVHHQWNGVLGLHYNPHPDLGLALTYHNPVPASDKIPHHLRMAPEMGVGVSYIIADLIRVRLDLSRQEKYNPDKKLEIGGGIESFIQNFVIFRLGYKSDPLQRRELWTAGLSFNGPRFKIDYAATQNSLDHNGALHSVDLRVPF